MAGPRDATTPTGRSTTRLLARCAVPRLQIGVAQLTHILAILPRRAVNERMPAAHLLPSTTRRKESPQ